MDGFLFVDKPKGMTSQGVCNKIKYALHLDKCGHSGTLDPNTTGIMVVACNKATKLLKLIQNHDKSYCATILFGYDSTTLDIDGKILKEVEMNFSIELLKEKLEDLVKQDEQIPPMTSAIKINGKKLYEYQRKNIEVTIPARKTKVLSYKILSNLKRNNNHLEIEIYLHVEKGFYVRSFARDLGLALGGCAILKELRRMSVGKFLVSQATDLDNICEDNIIPITDMFPFPKVEVNDYIASLVSNGTILDERQTKINEVFYVTNNCDIIAIYEPIASNQYKPLLIFK